MPLIKIDDREIEVKAGAVLLKTALDNGIDIPYYCYHPRLSIAGNCRMCQVEVEGMRGLQISCNVKVGEMPPERKIDGKYDMVVRTGTADVLEARRRVLELLLLNHPLDCSVCDQAGECLLQDYSYQHGNAHSRFGESKRVNPKKQLGPEVIIYPNRCILCSRCVRFCEEIAGEPQLLVRHRGYDSLIDVREGELLDNLLSGNTVDICPVGSLVSADFLHKTRVWNLDSYDSICTDCSVGCNIKIEVKDNEIQRLKPRFNEKVNDYWMCDNGRLGYHELYEMKRLTKPLVRSGSDFEPISWEGAFKMIIENFLQKNKSGGRGERGVVGSASMTNEENYVLAKIARSVFKSPENTGLYPGLMDGDPIIFKSGFRISPDKTPNRLGASHMLGVGPASVLEGVKGKKVRALYFLDGGLRGELAKEDHEFLKRLKFLVVQSIYMTDAAKQAHLVLPGYTYAEKSGTMTNDKGLVQRLIPALEAPPGITEDWELIAELGRRLGGKGFGYESASEVTAEIAENVPGYSGCTYYAVGKQGRAAGKVRRTVREAVV